MNRRDFLRSAPIGFASIPVCAASLASPPTPLPKPPCRDGTTYKFVDGFWFILNSRGALWRVPKSPPVILPIEGMTVTIELDT